ncbi:Glycine cleavage system transcriptional antiactivator GcvR [hydrothermal vent metagenome]|uniref:Glycine cleavage system transcriptional antiactivator GcvR n=1 Tax=hydrothermal vent metagenome TaxID=652676 RepID=A0A3B0YXU0_9ZZZZ
MTNWYMLTLVGKDRPGIVAKVTSALFAADCNLGETSMLRLGDNFTVMMLVQSGDAEARLREALAPILKDLSLVLHVDPVEAGLHQHPVPDICILVHGADRVGIVSQVTSRAADAGLNILDLDSDVGGTEAEPIYILQIEGMATQGIGPIREALAPLQTTGVKVEVRPIETLIG